MRGEPVVGIQPAVMQWARESIGLTVEDVAERISKRPDDISNWESGTDAPTYVQLERLAYEVYKRPIAVFFLPKPPEEHRPQSEFRTLPAFDLKNLASDTFLHIRKAHAYQIALAELFDGRNPAQRKLWEDCPLDLRDSPANAASAIRQELGITVEGQARWGDDADALLQWRQAVERRGIFVFKNSFMQKEISGFCLRDDEFPLIYLNNSTTKTRQIFSLLHELAHLLFNVNGLSKFDHSYVRQLPQHERKIEVFCNAVASEVLIPGSDFERQAASLPSDLTHASDAVFSNLAQHYGVSREAILRRFLDLGRVDQAFYEEKVAEWTGQLKKAKGGGDWYATTRTYISDRMLNEVFGRYFRNQVSAVQAAEYLGVAPKNLPGLEERVLKRTAQ
ncbi:ImmA/IrrE family metallo-endopeptidase [Xanthomonas albilineans]|uniref:ImmA/IrrE family metallo-endopeptidase n=1 Tax=Xanthomonas albilineans TaxID=29447 RepID=UPI0005F32D6D|nr:ImmA/IrrE family metallo-endopeptidase [Xanthomonas albilineans]